MGSPVSPIVCNIYMKDFEQRALAEASDPPRWWKRYCGKGMLTIHIRF